MSLGADERPFVFIRTGYRCELNPGVIVPTFLLLLPPSALPRRTYSPLLSSSSPFERRFKLFFETLRLPLGPYHICSSAFRQHHELLHRFPLLSQCLHLIFLSLSFFIFFLSIFTNERDFLRNSTINYLISPFYS